MCTEQVRFHEALSNLVRALDGYDGEVIPRTEGEGEHPVHFAVRQIELNHCRDLRGKKTGKHKLPMPAWSSWNWLLSQSRLENRQAARYWAAVLRWWAVEQIRMGYTYPSAVTDPKRADALSFDHWGFRACDEGYEIVDTSRLTAVVEYEPIEHWWEGHEIIATLHSFDEKDVSIMAMLLARMEEKKAFYESLKCNMDAKQTEEP